MPEEEAAADERIRSFMATLKDHGDIHAMFDILPDIYFYIKDSECQFVLCNDATLKLFNLKKKSEIVGKTEYDFFPTRMADPIRHDDLEIMRTGVAIVKRTEVIVDENGQLTWVSTSKLPLYGRAENVLGLMGTTRVLSRTDMLPENYLQFAPVIEFIQSNYHQSIDVANLAAMSHLSVSQFRKRFRQLFNLAPQQFILKVRVQAACHLLSNSDESLATIAAKCGFCDQSYFTRQFSAFLDISPKKYRDTWS